ncbi:MAG: hypothetical protein RML45_08240 [Acetobacteraceae bacterium]|nr:hypothetical protein [Acetobacteraceae bacterium]
MLFAAAATVTETKTKAAVGNAPDPVHASALAARMLPEKREMTGKDDAGWSFASWLSDAAGLWQAIQDSSDTSL